MSNHLDFSAASKAAHSISKSLIDKFLSGRPFLKGEEIISFSNNQGINYLVIREIFRKWNDETSKLQSPYFDYNHTAVAKALTDFLNTLSNHILVKAKDFEVLLQKAVLHFIALQVNPNIILDVFYSDQSNITLRELETDLKFIKSNKFIFEELIKFLKVNGKESLSFDQTKSNLTTLLENNKEKLDVDSEFVNMINIACGNIDIEVNNSPITSLDTSMEKDVSQISLPQVSTMPKQLTINETLAKHGESTLINRLSKLKIESIQTEIPLIRKFLFIKELFKENNVDYSFALSIADNSESFDSAKSQLIEQFSAKYNWEDDNEALMEFLEIIERRYQ